MVTALSKTLKIQIWKQLGHLCKRIHISVPKQVTISNLQEFTIRLSRFVMH